MSSGKDTASFRPCHSQTSYVTRNLIPFETVPLPKQNPYLPILHNEFRSVNIIIWQTCVHSSVFSESANCLIRPSTWSLRTVCMFLMRSLLVPAIHFLCADGMFRQWTTWLLSTVGRYRILAKSVVCDIPLFVTDTQLGVSVLVPLTVSICDQEFQLRA